MTPFCTPDDVQQRLRRQLTEEELEWFDSMQEEAQDLVLSYLGCTPNKYSDNLPSVITTVTSRMIARVIQEGNIEQQPTPYGATHYTATAGPFSGQVQFAAGSRTGAPWITKVDKTMLDPHRCTGKAYSINTAPQAPKYTPQQAHHIRTTTNLGWQPI